MNSLQLLRETQFHGGKRLASSKYRFYWALALIFFFCCSLTVLSITVNRYFRNPTFVAHNEMSVTIKPFPTVILCPEVEFPQYKISAFLQDLKYPEGINASDIAKIIPQLGVFFSSYVNYTIADLEKVQQLLDYNEMSIETAGKMLTMNCRDIIIRCRWLNSFSRMNCSAAFQFELTSHGFCCIFNGFSLKKEIRHQTNHDRRTTKRLFVDSIGFTDSLILAVNQSMRPRGDLNVSYKWLVLKTSRYTDIISTGTPLSPGVETWAGYKSMILHVTDDSKRLGDNLRQCRMMQEPLKYFPIYHKRYCLLECEMERVKQQCNCVQVIHPHPPSNSATPICNAKHIACLRKAAGVSYSQDLKRCRCPRTCDSDIEVTQVYNFELLQDSREYDNFYSDLDFDQISIIRVYLLKHIRKATSRHSFFPIHQLISDLGGVFTVFFGCSVLSMLEMLQLTCYAIRDIYYQHRDMKKELQLINVKSKLRNKYLK